MQATIPKLKFALATNALIHFFNSKYWTIEEVEFTRSFCQLYDSNKIWKLKLRLLCEENNDMIVAAVLADATDEERTFLYDKYLHQFSFTKLSLKLHVHFNALQKWRDKFLTDIASLLEYKLPVSDMFSRNKIEALIFVLERTIVFHEQYGKADKNFLDFLKLKLNGYQNLLFTIKQYINFNTEDIACLIIKSKILNPHFSAEELESYIGVSHTTISRHIRNFQKRNYQLIN